MTQRSEHEQVAETLPEVEDISPEAIEKAKAMIGMRLRTEQFTRDASLGALINFANGIGDANPLFRDPGVRRLFQVRLGHRPPLRPLHAPLVGPHPVGSARRPRLLCGQRLGVLPSAAPRRRRQLRRAGAGRAGEAEPLLGHSGHPVRSRPYTRTSGTNCWPGSSAGVPATSGGRPGSGASTPTFPAATTTSRRNWRPSTSRS